MGLGVELRALVAYCDELLGASAFADACPNGLQVEGRPEVQHVVSGVTACQALVDAAAEAGADAVLVHHGWFWRGEDPRVTGMRRRRLASLLRHDLSLIAYHLPLDAHPEVGNNAQLGRLLGIAPDGRLGGPAGTPGLVMTGTLTEPVAGPAFAAHVARCLGRAPLHVPGPAAPIRRLAWCTGAGQALVELAVAAGVDAYLTGEASEQTVHAAREGGVHLFAAGHHATERGGVQALGAHLAARFGLRVQFIDVPNPV